MNYLKAQKVFLGFFFFLAGISCLTVAILADCSHTLRGETGCVPTASHL